MVNVSANATFWSDFTDNSFVYQVHVSSSLFELAEFINVRGLISRHFHFQNFPSKFSICNICSI